MTLEELRKDKRDAILRICAKHGAYNIRGFGSAARGEAGESSDIDLLVELEPGRSLLDHAALVVDLEEILGRKVDVVTENGVYWLLRDASSRRRDRYDQGSARLSRPHPGVPSKIEWFTTEGRSRFFRDVIVQDAVLRNFEVIGEAPKRLDDAYRAAHPEIPWCALAGLRHVLIHQYEGIALERVWAIVERE